MSSEESQNSANSAENPTKSDSESDSGSDGDTSTSGSMRYVASHSFAYDDEPLAEPVQNADINPEDPDGLLPATLEQRATVA